MVSIKPSDQGIWETAQRRYMGNSTWLFGWQAHIELLGCRNSAGWRRSPEYMRRSEVDLMMVMIVTLPSTIIPLVEVQL